MTSINTSYGDIQTNPAVLLPSGGPGSQGVKDVPKAQKDQVQVGFEIGIKVGNILSELRMRKPEMELAIHLKQAKINDLQAAHAAEVLAVENGYTERIRSIGVIFKGMWEKCSLNKPVCRFRGDYVNHISAVIDQIPKLLQKTPVAYPQYKDLRPGPGRGQEPAEWFPYSNLSILQQAVAIVGCEMEKHMKEYSELARELSPLRARYVELVDLEETMGDFHRKYLIEVHRRERASRLTAAYELVNGKYKSILWTLFVDVRLDYRPDGSSFVEALKRYSERRKILEGHMAEIKKTMEDVIADLKASIG